MEPLEFLRPALVMKQEAVDFREAFFQQGENFIHGSGRWDKVESYECWVEQYAGSGGLSADGFFSQVYFVRRQKEEKLIGVIEVRYGFSEEKYHYGHMGYSVRPDERGHGYGTSFVAWGLAHVRARGVRQAIICCYEDNAASRRAIEKNGLMLYRVYPEAGNGKMVREYRQP